MEEQLETNSQAEKNKHNSLNKVPTGGSKGGKPGQLRPSTVNKHFFIKKEICFPQVAREKEADGS